MQKYLRSTRFLITLGFMLALALLLLPSQAALAQETPGAAPSTRTVSINGSGRVEAQPDAAVVTLGVQTEAEEAAVALSENSRRTQALLDALLELGIAEEALQTQTVRLQPRYSGAAPDSVMENNGASELVGYTATNLVEVQVADLDQVGAVLDAAVAAGGNRIENIRFEISDRTTLLADARQAAWNDAQAKAEQYAELAGAELGEVLTINAFEQSPGPAPQFAAVRETADAVPIQPGTQTVSVEVQVTWRLE